VIRLSGASNPKGFLFPLLRITTMQQTLINREIIGRYIGQPGQLPADLRARIEREWGDEPVQLYAMADLDAGMRLGESWVALGPSRVAVARAVNGSWDVRSIERAHIQAVHVIGRA
jgi:hypothetical protein